MAKAMKLDHLQLGRDLDGAKPLVNIDRDGDLHIPAVRPRSQSCTRSYPPTKQVDWEGEVTSEFTNGGSQIPRSKCAVAPYFYGSFRDDFYKHRKLGHL
jgi:hypothetical protein